MSPIVNCAQGLHSLSCAHINMVSQACSVDVGSKPKYVVLVYHQRTASDDYDSTSLC